MVSICSVPILFNDRHTHFPSLVYIRPMDQSAYKADYEKIKAGLEALQEYLYEKEFNTGMTGELAQQYTHDIKKKMDVRINTTGLLFAGLFIGSIALIAARRRFQ